MAGAGRTTSKERLRPSALWAELASEHVRAIGAFFAEPRELCNCEQTCATWREALRDLGDEDDLWRGLCFAWYENMATRIAASGSAASASCSSSPALRPASSPTTSPMLPPTSPALTASTISSPLVGRLGDEDGVSAGELLMPAAAIDCQEEVEIQLCILESAASGAADAADAKPKRQLAPAPPAWKQQTQRQRPVEASAADVQRGWRDIFRMRYLRQQEWDRRRQKPGVSEKKAEEAKDAKPKANGKFHPSGRPKVTRGKENGRERYHAPRLRACKRCGVDFDPRMRDAQSCSWHTGRYVPVDEDGVVAATSVGRDFERRAQRLMKAHNRTKGSKKANMIVFDRPCETGVAREGGVVWRWSCCRDENLVARGCCSGQHS